MKMSYTSKKGEVKNYEYLPYKKSAKEKTKVAQGGSIISSSFNTNRSPGDPVERRVKVQDQDMKNWKDEGSTPTSTTLTGKGSTQSHFTLTPTVARSALRA